MNLKCYIIIKSILNLGFLDFYLMSIYVQGDHPGISCYIYFSPLLYFFSIIFHFTKKWISFNMTILYYFTCYSFVIGLKSRCDTLSFNIKKKGILATYYAILPNLCHIKTHIYTSSVYKKKFVSVNDHACTYSIPVENYAT